MLTPFVAVLRIEAKFSWQSMVIDLVMVTVPKAPESRQSISPLREVFEIAPAKVLQGAVRLHGLRSSPTPETHVRDCACASVERARMKIEQVRSLIVMDILFIIDSP